MLVQKIKHKEVSNGDLGDEALKKFEALFEEKSGMERPSKEFAFADSKIHAGLIGGVGWGRSSLPFRAELEEVAAFFWDFSSRSNMEISGDVERTVGGENEDDDLGIVRNVVSRRRKLESSHRGHHHDRSFDSEMTFHRIDDDTIIINTAPLHDEKKKKSTLRTTLASRGSIAEGSGAVNAQERVVVRLRRSGDGRTKVDLALNVVLGLGVSQEATRHFVQHQLDTVADMSIYFQRLVPLEEYDANDGKALGHDLLWRASSSKKRVERLTEMFKNSRGLRELVSEQPWLKAMMVTGVEGSLHRNRPVVTKLECVDEAEVR